ncbi:MAG: hypothetical protein IID44_14385 [Planctomycetes bacterium]|nr:hypothetical protein [Planctomycetota bacterium]
MAMFAYMARRSLSNGLMAAFMSVGGAAGGALTGLVSRQAAGDGIPEPAAR